MPIKLLTGKPGHGKTLYLVHHLRKIAGTRPIFQHGVTDLNIDLVNELENPLDWQNCPDGSLVIVDECQLSGFGRDQSGEKDERIKALTLHRKRGFDFILISQASMFVHPFVRKLVDEHTHLVRRFGLHLADAYTWGSAVGDVDGQATRKAAVKTVFKFPKDAFNLYTSAQIHNIKRKIPWYIPVGIAAGLSGVALLSYSVLGFGDAANTADDIAAMNGGNPQNPGYQVAAKPDDGLRDVRTAVDYVAEYVPVIEGMPWTAPAFMSREPRAQPEVYCISSAKRCTCLTEQGTRYKVLDAICRDIARNGVYNPFREPLREDEDDARMVARESAPVPSQTASQETGEAKPYIGEHYKPPGLQRGATDQPSGSP